MTMDCHLDAGVYDGTMAQPKQEFPPHGGHEDTTAWLEDIGRRRAATPSKDEIQAALTEALAAGFSVAGFARVTGVKRQTLYANDYVIERPPPVHIPTATGPADGDPAGEGWMMTCSCGGWSGGPYPSAAEAAAGHRAHVTDSALDYLSDGRRKADGA